MTDKVEELSTDLYEYIVSNGLYDQIKDELKDELIKSNIHSQIEKSCLAAINIFDASDIITTNALIEETLLSTEKLFSDDLKKQTMDQIKTLINQST